MKTKRGLDWNYDVGGEGEPLVFLHGWGVNMLVWRQQFRYFSQFYRVLSLDLPGHGKTAWQKMELGGMAADVLEILDALRMERVSIVGSSFGGLVVLKMYELAPDRFKRFSFVGTQPKLAQSPDNPFGIEMGEIRKLAQQIEKHYPSMVDIFFRSLFTKEERSSRRFRWMEAFRKTDVLPQQDALENILDILEKEDLREVLYRIQQPVQFLNGTEDHICPLGIYSKLQEKLPQARFDWFHQCGHFPFLSKPHEFNQALEDFLKQPDHPVRDHPP